MSISLKMGLSGACGPDGTRKIWYIAANSSPLQASELIFGTSARSIRQTARRRETGGG
jgi:hypothetical protein